MEIKPSEIEKTLQLFLQKFAPDASNHKEAAQHLAKELQELMQPVLNKLNDLEREIADIEQQLWGERDNCVNLEEELSESILDKEWDKMVKRFWDICERSSLETKTRIDNK